MAEEKPFFHCYLMQLLSWPFSSLQSHWDNFTTSKNITVSSSLNVILRFNLFKTWNNLYKNKIIQIHTFLLCIACLYFNDFSEILSDAVNCVLFGYNGRSEHLKDPSNFMNQCFSESQCMAESNHVQVSHTSNCKTDTGSHNTEENTDEASDSTTKLISAVIHTVQL